jgi:hypothetical protein
MKKVFSFVMAVAVIATVLGVSVGSASAASSSVVLYLPGVTQQELKNASMFVNSEYHKVECTLKDAETGKVVCHVPGKYAGEDVTLFVAGQVFNASVPNPNTPDAPEGEETLTCGEGEVLWYSFDWYTYGEFYENVEVPASTWEYWEANGFFEVWAYQYGAIAEITGSFCAPELLPPA